MIHLQLHGSTVTRLYRYVDNTSRPGGMREAIKYVDNNLNIFGQEMMQKYISMLEMKHNWLVE